MNKKRDKRNKKQDIHNTPRTKVAPYTLLMVAILTAALYFGNYILWLFFFFLLFLLVIDIMHFIYATIRKPSVSQTLSTQNTECYSTVFLKVRVANAIADGFVICYGSDAETLYSDVAKKEFEISMVQNNIGLQHISIKKLFIKSIFGLFVIKQAINQQDKTELTCLIVPIIRTLKPKNSFVGDIKLSALNTSLYRNEFEDLVGNRAYIVGDPLNLINYKKSTAIKKAVVKEYDKTKSGFVYNIFVDYFPKESRVVVAEAVLASNDYFIALGGETLLLQGYDGYYNRYEKDNEMILAKELAVYNFKDSIIASPDELKNASLPTVVILSEHKQGEQLSFIQSLPDFSIVFLVAEAIKGKEEISNVLSQLGNKNIVMVDETMMSAIVNQ